MPQVPEIPDADLEALRHEQTKLVELVRASRPADQSEDESRAFKQLARLSLPAGPALVAAFRAAFEKGLKELVSEEGKTQDVERRLALRHIEQAIDTFAVLIESAAAALAEMPEATLRLAIRQMTDALAHGELPPMSADDRTLLRFELDFLMALASLDASLDELTYWAHQAVVGARRVQALAPPRLMARWRGELARLRAKASWEAWDEDEVKRELEPWPRPSPSP
jgi:hypothetical protein